MQDAAEKIIRYFYEAFSDERSTEKNCILARCFKTHRLADLPRDLQAKATAGLAHSHGESDPVICLTLLASAGEMPAWNDPTSSAGHSVIPLEDAAAVNRAPMISQLIRQLGLGVEDVLFPNDQLLLEAEEKTYGVFHIEDALGNRSIPAQQDFVVKHQVKSVLGFGGLLPSGDLFSVILFSRVHISREVATLFRTLALSVKLVFLPFTRGPIFASDPAPEQPAAGRANEQEQVRSEAATLRQLIPALEAAALFQTGRLQDVIADLNQQKEAFQTLGERFGSMLESTTDAVYMLDRAWRFSYLNGRASTLLRMPAENLLGKNIWEVFPDAYGQNLWHQYRLVMEHRRAAVFEQHFPDLLDKWFEIHAFPSEPGIAVFFHDITDRLKAEAALIKNEKLAAVGRLAASIAHEINNPLESVTNLLYLARTSTELAAIQEHLSTADRELRRVGAITSQTLRFHRQSSSPVQVTSEELLESVLSIYHGRIVNSSIHVERHQQTAHPVLCFDGEIRQVLNNLVGNAIDAMHPQGGRLLLRSRGAINWKTGRSGLSITVADTGCGMSNQTRHQALEPFFTTKGAAGTGLGLWISHEIIARHNGSLALRSSQMPGRTGTVITIFLPYQATLR